MEEAIVAYVTSVGARLTTKGVSWVGERISSSLKSTVDEGKARRRLDQIRKVKTLLHRTTAIDLVDFYYTPMAKVPADVNGAEKRANDYESWRTCLMVKAT